LVKLSELPAQHRDRYFNAEILDFGETPRAPARPLSESRICVLSTAGLHLRGDAPFVGYATDYRTIPRGADMDDLVMSHLSTNFDRAVRSGHPTKWRFSGGCLRIAPMRHRARRPRQSNPRAGPARSALHHRFSR